MPLSVIGVGMPRTGTLSLKVALETLGFAPCHHMSEVFAHPHLAPLWERAFDGTLTDWEDIFGGYRATVDAPAAYIWRPIVERYPDAKVILSLRDPEKWYASFAATIGTDRHGDRMMGSRLKPMLIKMAAHVGMTPPAPGERPAFPPKDEMLARFNAHNEAVRRTIAPERLLVFEASQGWEPLCRFLGRPVPDMPYPRVNDAGQFHEHKITDDETA
jgi:hypothetical protein